MLIYIYIYLTLFGLCKLIMCFVGIPNTILCVWFIIFKVYLFIYKLFIFNYHLKMKYYLKCINVIMQIIICKYVNL